MKKFLALVTSILAVIACCFIVACTDETTQPVVITATDSSFEYEGKTLKDYMDILCALLKYKIKALNPPVQSSR